MKRTRHPYRPTPTRDGFTLVELLVVITIIGAIAALSIPAISMVLKTARKSAMSSEMAIIDQGINDYNTKYGDYPPDFSDWGIVRRHYLKIFPDIADSELNLLFSLCDTFPDNNPTATPPTSPAPVYDPFVMDRAESLVWSLGGFSSDPQFPFTGDGGPLQFLDTISGVATTDRTLASHYQYRPQRTNALVEFKPERLTFRAISSAAGAVYNPGNYDRNVSTDEPQNVTNLPALYQTPDIFPTYVLREGHKPVVYFDARTYIWNNGSGVFNGYVDYENGVNASSITVDDLDGVRPVYSTQPNTQPASTYTSLAASASALQFMNPATFQLMSPGLDGFYGTLLDANAGAPSDDVPVYFQTNGNLIRLNPAGPCTPVTTITRFDLTGVIPKSTNRMRDNMANFIDGTFEDQLP